MIKCAVIAFPGNNCETETARAANRNGFDTKIFRWNQKKDLEKFSPQFIILPGGFSFEDRGRSGLLASKEPIFDYLREVAQTGTIILGICNGAQMVVESGLIPAEIALAKNIRRDKNGHVLGTGFFNSWVYLKPENTNTVFTKYLDKNILKVPVAHGEGRFVSRDATVLQQIEKGELVALRYCDEGGKVSEAFPITPNGSSFATAAICNKEGTIMAMMPHPERFFDNFDGDNIFQSIKKSIELKEVVPSVVIGDFAALLQQEILPIKNKENTLWIEKKLIITDNENFSVKSTAQNICGKDIQLEKTIGFEISSSLKDLKIQKTENSEKTGGCRQLLTDSGLIYNESKEFLINDDFYKEKQSVYVSDFEDDEADHLADLLTKQLGGKITVKIYKGWHFPKNTDKKDIEKIIQSRLFANPNSSQLFKK